VATSKIRIGWIGVGAMGQPICRHLLKAGYALDVYDKDPTKISALVSEGASAGISAGELAGKCDLIISMVWDDDGLRDVVLGPTGVLTGVRTGISYIDMSTVSPKVSEEIAAQLARHDIPYLRAPVSGSVPVAEAGKLTIYASGPRILFDSCQEILKAFSTKQTYVGTKEEGRIVKLAINLILQMSTAILGEVLAFGARAGVDRSTLMDAINDSIVASPHYAVRSKSIKQRDLAFTVRWASPKDLEIAMSVAKETGAIMPIASLVQQYIRIITNRPMPQNGFTALTTLMEDINPVAAEDLASRLPGS